MAREKRQLGGVGERTSDPPCGLAITTLAPRSFGGRPVHKGKATRTPAHDALPTLPRAAARLVQGPFPRTTLPAARSRPPNNPLTYRLPCLPDLTANLTTYLRTYPPNYLSTYAISTQRTQRKRDDVNLPTYLPT